MYENILLRLRATQNNEEKHQMKVTYERVAFIKAYLIKNAGLSEEEITVDLNTERRTPAYCLGRLFAILEATQERSSGNTNSTIFGKYFNSACATPGVVFPVIMKLNTAHLEKLRKTDSGYSVHYSRLIGELVEAAGEFPKTLTIEEQGEFIIGYWCQRQERFKKVSSNENSAE
jgi:CRISPR-associated protein Csd1